MVLSDFHWPVNYRGKHEEIESEMDGESELFSGGLCVFHIGEVL